LYRLNVSGGGKLLFPGNKKYLIGSVEIPSNCIIDVEENATILGSTDGQNWPLIDALENWP